MLISDQKQFIFIHIEKAAGTSVTSALGPYSIEPPRSKWASLQRAVGLPKDHRRFKFPFHGSLQDVQRIMQADLFAQYYKFSFVRNPWDRLVSEYNAAIKKNRRARHRKIKAMASFTDYVKYEIKRDKMGQLNKLVNLEGELQMDFIGRFENLAADFKHICDHVGVEAQLEQLNAFKHASYRDYYDDEAIELVRQHWAADIEAFSYEF